MANNALATIGLATRKSADPLSAAKKPIEEVILPMFSRAANMAALRHLAAVRSQHASVDKCWFNVELICPLEEVQNELAHLKRVVGMIRRKRRVLWAYARSKGRQQWMPVG